MGFALLILSAVLWAGIIAVPFLPVTTAWKVGIGSAVAVVAEVAFWVSAVILGREVVSRYRRYLDPRSWSRDDEEAEREATREPPADRRSEET